jgi:hypothetical protein
MNKELLSIKIKLNNIVKDILSVYGLKQEGKWIYSTTSNNSYYDLLVNSRLGVFKYRLNNSESKILVYITDKYAIIVEDRIKFLVELPKKIDNITEDEFIALKEFLLQSTTNSDIENFLNNGIEIDLQAIYGSKCSESTINNIRMVEEALLNNQITIYDMKDFYEKCYQVRNFENKEVHWTFRLKLDDGKGNLLKTTYIDVFFIGKTSKRIVVVCKDIVTEQEYTLNIGVDNFVESISEQWRDIYEL